MNELKIGNEYWLTRELMIALGYIKWKNFNKVIKKAINTCIVAIIIFWNILPTLAKR